MQATYTKSDVHTCRIVLQPAFNYIASVVHDILITYHHSLFHSTTKTQQFHKSFSLWTVDTQCCQRITDVSVWTFRPKCFVAVRDPGVRRWTVVQGVNECKCECDRVKVSLDLRFWPTLTWSHTPSFAPRMNTHRRTPGSRTATNNRAGCSFMLILVSCI